MPYGITQCYLPPGRGDSPALRKSRRCGRLTQRRSGCGCVVGRGIGGGGTLCAWQCTAKSAPDSHVLACNFTKYSLIKMSLLADSAMNLC